MKWWLGLYSFYRKFSTLTCTITILTVTPFGSFFGHLKCLASATSRWRMVTTSFECISKQQAQNENIILYSHIFSLHIQSQKDRIGTWVVPSPTTYNAIKLQSLNALSHFGCAQCRASVKKGDNLKLIQTSNRFPLSTILPLLHPHTDSP